MPDSSSFASNATGMPLVTNQPLAGEIGLITVVVGEMASILVSVTWTAPWYQPLASGSGTLADVVGEVRSIWMPLTVLVAVLPALSVQLAVEDRLAPSPVTLSAAGCATGPE